jgi:hypothetical protein
MAVKRTEQRCQCGLHELTRARGKYGLKRWRRVVEYFAHGYCHEHGADVCWAIWRGDQPDGPKKPSQWYYEPAPLRIDIIYPRDEPFLHVLQRVAGLD